MYRRNLLVLTILSLAPVVLQAQTPDPLTLQARDVLAKHCFECHGKNAQKPKGKLNVFDRAHLDDKERKIVVPKKPKDSELWVRVEAGDMPPAERPKMTKAEEKILHDWIAAGGVAFPLEAQPQPKTAAAPTERAAQVKEIFRLRCAECHGGAKTQGGVRILDHSALVAKKRIVPGKADESLIFQLVTANDNSVMPPAGQPRLNQTEIDTIRLWIAEGAANFPADVAVPAEPKRDPAFKDVAGVDYVHKKILAYVRDLRAEERAFKRFFSINHILTAGATANELDLQREALVKAINHLSWQATLAPITPIDGPVNSIYAIDLRDLGWHEQPYSRWQGSRNLGKSHVNFWDIALLEYPYGIVYEDSDTYDRLIDEFLIPANQVRPVVYVRSDWFVSTITQPPFYEDFMRFPFDLKDLEFKLGVDSAANVRDYRARRAGMSVSGVSKNNRVVERHPAKYGAYWKSFDFRSNKGLENMFRDPINFHPAGGEMIFNLPNGLQGYYVADGNGNRVEFAPTDIVTDKFAEDKTVRNGLACIRCHDRGVKEFVDVVRPAVQRLPGSPGFDKRLVLQVYPEQKEMDDWLKQDGERFTNAMARVLGKPLTREPLIPVSRRFLDDPLLLGIASGELGLMNPQGLEFLFRSPQFSALGLTPLAAQGVVRRDAWEDYFDLVVRGMGLGVPVVPIDGLSRKDFPASPPPGDVELKTNKRGNVFEPGDELVIEVKNNSHKPVYIELIGRSARGRMVILAPATTIVNAKESYRFPPQGGIKIKGGVGKEQILLYASPSEFPAGELLRGDYVTDRVVHPFFQFRKDGTRLRLVHDVTHLVKKTIEIETK